jgi:hypothetical protein
VNNVLCGSPTASDRIARSGAYTAMANDLRDSCPDGVTDPKSKIVATLRTMGTGAAPGNPVVNCSAAVVSNLSVKYVQFFVDNASAPVATVEVQDVNPAFAQDHKWLYHAAIDTSAMEGGQHKVTARVTDVAGEVTSVEASIQVVRGTTVSDAKTPNIR